MVFLVESTVNVCFWHIYRLCELVIRIVAEIKSKIESGGLRMPPVSVAAASVAPLLAWSPLLIHPWGPLIPSAWCNPAAIRNALPGLVLTFCIFKQSVVTVELP